MKIIQVGAGLAVIPNPEYSGNIVTDEFSCNYQDEQGVLWSIPSGLVDKVKGILQKGEEVGSKKELSITDLLALKTTYHVDDIIKLKENDLL